MICIYHNADLDGHCSGALVKLKHPMTQMIGMNYGDSLDTLPSREPIYVVDFHIDPFERMIELMATHPVIWIDHHKTAIEDYKDNEKQIEATGSKCYLDNSLAACEITWKVLHPDSIMPKAVRLLGRYDVWDHSDPDVLPFQFACRLNPTEPSYDESMSFWNGLLMAGQISTDEIIHQGRTIIQYIDTENLKVCQHTAYPVKFDGLNCIACNRSLTNSKLFDSVSDQYDAMITYYFNGKRWTVSIYSTKMDVSNIAKKRGGGGHAKACGFTCQELPSELLEAHK